MSSQAEDDRARYPDPRHSRVALIGGYNCGDAVLIVDIAAAAAGAGFVVPFVKAIATKAGEDCYQALRNLVRRRDERSADEILVVLTDPDTGTVMIFVPPLPDEAILQLACLKPRQIAGKVIAWEGSPAKWSIRRKP